MPTVSSWDQINRKNKDDSVSKVLDILPESPSSGCAFNSIQSNTRLEVTGRHVVKGLVQFPFWGENEQEMN